MYGKPIYLKVNQLRYDSFHRNIKVRQARYLVLLMACISAFLLLAEHHVKRMLKEPIIRHSYQFPNVPSHAWHSWKVDGDGSSTLSGLVVRLYHRN